MVGYSNTYSKEEDKIMSPFISFYDVENILMYAPESMREIKDDLWSFGQYFAGEDLQDKFENTGWDNSLWRLLITLLDETSIRLWVQEEMDIRTVIKKENIADRMMQHTSEYLEHVSTSVILVLVEHTILGIPTNNYIDMWLREQNNAASSRQNIHN